MLPTVGLAIRLTPLIRADSKLVIEQIRETAIERKEEQDGKMISLEAVDASDDKAREVLGYN